MSRRGCEGEHQPPVICSGRLELALVLGSALLFAGASHADTTTPSEDAAPAAIIISEPEFSFWVDAAPMTMVIDQMAALAGKTAEIEGLAEVPVSGRFSGSLDNLLRVLSSQYPVAFDVEGDVLRANDASALTSVSIAMLSTELDGELKDELQVSEGSGNKLEFREDAVRISGHPAFVRRTATSITKALVRARGEALAGAPESEPQAVDTIADAGSVEVLADIQDEGKAPTDQASLSKPIRWVTDIPGYNTF
ncbi:hypothetical protein [Granulosicoccus antarcticus]|uniref:Uncharacterized protein n=1 Tax=Granulosicoccus antarcticus IMCC3135 TaxID=1192854 RepID=A0A2Z2NZ76_9GAMM|nr:hypothetical protein [Granulosicoccus antarcticus]ASJ76593.1 hypothetical protein IMCC3135_32740 [Granulosicoccus antarcticus IMCC3135]